MVDGTDQLLDFVKLSGLTVSTANRVMVVQVTGAGDAGDDSTAEVVDRCEVVQPLGLMASPTLGASTEALIARLGDTPIALALIDKGRAPQAVEAGEVRLYGPGADNASAVVRVRATGAINLLPKTGQDITLNAGTLRVARETDPVTIDATLATWIAQVTAAVNGLAPGSVTAVPGATAGTITSGAGAANVKA